MLHRFPERIAVNAELQRLVLHNSIQVGLRQSAYKTKQPRFVFAPALFQARIILELSRVGKRGWRTSLKSFQPNPFATIDMCQRVAHRTKARAHGLNELFTRGAGRPRTRPVIGPAVADV